MSPPHWCNRAAAKQPYETALGLPAYKRLSIVLDEKAPTYSPPAPVRIVQPEPTAVGEE
jgi:hypothetical protein